MCILHSRPTMCAACRLLSALSSLPLRRRTCPRLAWEEDEEEVVVVGRGKPAAQGTFLSSGRHLVRAGSGASSGAAAEERGPVVPPLQPPALPIPLLKPPALKPPPLKPPPLQQQEQQQQQELPPPPQQEPQQREEVEVDCAMGQHLERLLAQDLQARQQQQLQRRRRKPPQVAPDASREAPARGPPIMTQLPHTASPGMWWPARCPLPASHPGAAAPLVTSGDFPGAQPPATREVLMGHFQSAYAASRVRDAAVLALEQLLPTEQPAATYCLGQVRDALLLMVSAAPGEPWSPNLLLYGLLRARARGVSATAPASCSRCCPATPSTARGAGARPGGRQGCGHPHTGEQQQGADKEEEERLRGPKATPTQRLMLAAHWELPDVLEEVTAPATAAGRPRPVAAAPQQVAPTPDGSSCSNSDSEPGGRARSGGRQRTSRPPPAAPQLHSVHAGADPHWVRGHRQPQWGLVPAAGAEGSPLSSGWNWWVVDLVTSRLITWPGRASSRQAATAALQRVLLGLGLMRSTPDLDTAGGSAAAAGGGGAQPAVDSSSAAGAGPEAGAGNRDGFEWVPAASITSTEVQAVLVQLVRCCGVPPSEVEVSNARELHVL
jgi:hypothetical protein